ncbi:IS701 family transposase [Streptomyces omiyaensis]|uniref:IS701 family transposase n=1 Tax=Streptomyces omiyaensis TaxID=68247 RepID=UPI003701A6EF
MHATSIGAPLAVGTRIDPGADAGLFASLPRSDQRLKAERYVAGLLTAHGRRTLRNVAGQFGAEVARRQSVHHFISESSWDWEPVRGELARRAEELLAPAAWVVRSAVVPKAGGHSVGVAEYYVPRLGRTVTGQQSFGAWLAGTAAAVPVHWRLVLPDGAAGEPGPRGRGPLPPAGVPAGPEGSAGELVLRAARSLPAGARPRPVVLDAPELGPLRMARHAERAGIRLVQRVGAGLVLGVDPSVLPGHGGLPVPAGLVVGTLRRLWRPCGRRAAGGGRGLSMAVPVTLPGAARGAGRLLVAQWPESDLSAARLWLADGRLGAAEVLRLSALASAAEREEALAVQRVGLRDFTGRSFGGWHRHITLASAAHLACVRARAGGAYGSGRAFGRGAAAGGPPPAPEGAGGAGVRLLRAG